jgi:Na+-transporting NADH:ubiquinone oxidoreductase subunit C
MNKEGNRFTFTFATILVIVVAILLSFASILLGPYQARNLRTEKMKNILKSVGVDVEANEAEIAFNKFIKEQIVLNNKGERVESEIKAFDIDLKKEQDKTKTGKADSQLFPLFIYEKDGKAHYIIPVRGKGLWGPIWGYIALDSDRNTVFGVSFGHKGETPGLGAEIDTEAFQNQFVGKKIFDEQENFVSVKVVKGGQTNTDIHAVDAISGATVTSNGVSDMIKKMLNFYIPYFKSVEEKAKL